MERALGTWAALPPGEDVAAVERRVASAHGAVVLGGSRGNALALPDAAQVRSVVADSWRRSRSNGLRPDAPAQDNVLEGVELDRYRRQHPMSAIVPVVRRLLVDDVADAGVLVAISDEHGRLLWVEGDAAARVRAERIHFVEGADWSEASAGTNAPGTAIALDHPLQIFAAEHFNTAVHQWSCTAAPVHDPVSGRIIGAIDITGGHRVAAPEVLTLIRATVALAESELRVQILEGRAFTTGLNARLTVLGATRPELRINATPRQLSQRHAEILLLLSEHPEGMSADHLAVLLDDNDLDSVTVRAELSRLRRVIGPELVGSRPYRLLLNLDTDVAEVRARLDVGDLNGALTQYQGPVLPASQAPGVAEVRGELRERVRAAVLRSGNALHLSSWTATVDGREDVYAWRALRAALPPGSPRHVQVSAQLAVLDATLGGFRR